MTKAFAAKAITDGAWHIQESRMAAFFESSQGPSVTKEKHSL
jgi:hypothetical protein